jgi:hypothetical protein
METNIENSHFKEVSKIFGVGIDGVERCRPKDGNVLYKRRQQIDPLLPFSSSCTEGLLAIISLYKSVQACCDVGE